MVIQTEVESRKPEYVQQYIRKGSSGLEPIAKFIDHISFPPKLPDPPEDKEPLVKPSPLDISEAQLNRARSIVLRDPRVQQALGDRFIEITSGVDVPPKMADNEESFPFTINFEFFSYSNQRAYRTGVSGDKITFLDPLFEGYQPPETQEEIERVLKLIKEDERFTDLIQQTQPEWILTVCEETVRCLFVQFVLPNGRTPLTVTIDLMTERLLNTEVISDH